jgi:S-DNA-T family DNA segregation ATPase FtsK/SpoIIIE
MNIIPCWVHWFHWAHFIIKRYLGLVFFGGVVVSRQNKQKRKYQIKKKDEKKKHRTIRKKNKGIRNEIAGILMLSLGLLVFLGYYVDDSIGVFGNMIRKLLTGIAGIPSFLIPILIIIYSIIIVFKKNKEHTGTKAIYVCTLLILISAIFQAGTYQYSHYQNRTPLDCIVMFYREGQNMVGGGVLGGIVALPLLLVFQTLGTIIILTSLSIINIILLTDISIYGLASKIKNIFQNGIKKLIEGIKESSKDEQLFNINENDGKMSNDYSDNDMDISVNLSGIQVNQDIQTDSLAENSDEPKVVDFQKRKKSKSKKSETEDLSQNLEEEHDSKYTKPGKDNYSLITGMSGGKMREIFYKYPHISLLNGNTENGKNARAYKNIAIEGAKKLEETLKSFNVEAKVVNVTMGPTVTRFEIQPSAGVKVSKIVNLADDIALNLASPGVRIEAPIPGKAAVGIEVPNKVITPVFLREVIESKEFNKHPSKVAFAVGKDISGECIVTDITKMPHLLIAGATGSGKSVCINSLIMSILYKSSPDEVKMLLVDPKVVELAVYNGIPHLLIPVVTDPKKAAGALNWAVQEMVNRYKMFAEKGVRDIKGYNELVSQSGDQELLPLVVIIIDELSDLMMVAPGEVEDAICRLAQMARAAGMHLIVATQRPSVDVITGLIKANIPSRISFAVSSQVDSRTILDMGGAEKLLGKGDMLFYPTGQQKPVRVQGTFVSDKEVERVVEFIKSQCNMEYDNSIIDEIDNSISKDNNTEEEYDELLPQVIEMVIEAGQASVSLVQRRFKVGYTRAARMIDQMEARGIVGGFEGSKPILSYSWIALLSID